LEPPGKLVTKRREWAVWGSRFRPDSAKALKKGSKRYGSEVPKALTGRNAHSDHAVQFVLALVVELCRYFPDRLKNFADTASV
jgi:hypothetical protein